MKEEVLYIMHTPWGWIKQRPHFFAEKLSKFFRVKVYALKTLRERHKFQLNKNRLYKNLTIKNFVLAGHLRPQVRNKKYFTLLYKLLFKFQIKQFSKYKYIWITNLIFYRYIENLLSPNQILIYDCMDDDLEFPSIKNDEDLVNLYNKEEKKVLERANIVLFSAKYLREKVWNRNKFDRGKSIVVNNAIEIKEKINEGKSEASQKLPVEIEEKLERIRRSSRKLVYIGTISEWMNFDLIIKSLEQNKDLSYFFIGPTEIEIPIHPNIVHLGSVERDYIYDFMEVADGLVMPFMVNELIRSVNPVKLYEYIAANKPIIAPLYEETEAFSPYIYTYATDEEYLQYCNKIGLGLTAKKSDSENVSFIQKNTWENRIDGVVKFIADKSL